MTFNIAQIEFFLVGSSGIKTLESVLEECKERAQDRMPIKVCFRIYDENQEITFLAKKIKAWNEKYGDFGELIKTYKFLPKSLNSLIFWLIGRKKIIWKADLDKIVCLSVCNHLRLRKNIAIERSDHSYRYVKNYERYELEGSVKKAANRWIFVFEPNELLADKNKLLAAIM